MLEQGQDRYKEQPLSSQPLLASLITHCEKCKQSQLAKAAALGTQRFIAAKRQAVSAHRVDLDALAHAEDTVLAPNLKNLRNGPIEKDCVRSEDRTDAPKRFCENCHTRSAFALAASKRAVTVQQKSEC